MPTQIDVALSVDALSPKLTGIGRYCLELARGMPTVPDIGKLSYFQGRVWLDDPEILLDPHSSAVRRGNLHRWLNNERHKFRHRHSIVHGPNYFIPDWAECGLITVHDLSIFHYPETHPAERILEFERKFKRSLDRAVGIITDSLAIRDEVIDFLGISLDRVFAVPLGADGANIATDAKDTTQSIADLVAGNYTFCLSTFEPRKRIDRLIDAYSEMSPSLRSRFPLVLAGASGWDNEALHARIVEAQREGWLRKLDFISDASRDQLFKGARLFVYPSRYEGFGLPPIEAMRHGVPTMVSDAATLMEVTKGAARVVNPEDIPGFSRALAEALEDETWQASARLSGKEVADGYRWQACIEKTAEVYRAVIKN